MFEEEKTFTVRLNFVAHFPEDYEGDEDDYVWLHDWETLVKPELLKIIMATLRASPAWAVHVRNRGMAVADEVEIALEKTFVTDV